MVIPRRSLEQLTTRTRQPFDAAATVLSGSGICFLVILWAMSEERSRLPEYTAEAYEEMENKRLIRLGIDPDGDPVEIMMEVDRRYKELQEKERQRKLKSS